MLVFFPVKFGCNRIYRSGDKGIINNYKSWLWWCHHICKQRSMHAGLRFGCYRGYRTDWRWRLKWYSRELLVVPPSCLQGLISAKCYRAYRSYSYSAIIINSGVHTLKDDGIIKSLLIKNILKNFLFWVPVG